MTAMNHAPNPSGASTLKRSLGILYQDGSGKGLTHPFFSLIMEAFRMEAEARGYEITFINMAQEGQDASIAEHCRQRGIEGVCILCGDFVSPQYKALAASGLPCVSVDHIYKGVPAVLSDNETGVQKLVDYAISMGHRRIAFIHGHNNSVVTRTRVGQFGNSMGYHNLPVPKEYIRDGLYHDIACTRRHVLELLRLPEPPTCILLPDDMTYFGAQEAARELSLRIPEDISFAGYDGIPLTQALKPTLTTIRQNSDDMGRVAARLLTDLIERPETASRKPRIFTVELFEGGTMARL